MTMIISSYTSIHPFLGAYIIHSVYDKPISWVKVGRLAVCGWVLYLNLFSI